MDGVLGLGNLIYISNDIIYTLIIISYYDTMLKLNSIYSWYGKTLFKIIKYILLVDIPFQFTYKKKTRKENHNTRIANPGFDSIRSKFSNYSDEISISRSPDS